MSLFSESTVKFPTAAIGDGIATKDFLEACKQVIPVIDKLGSTAFSPVKSDINGNIQRLQTRYETDPSKYDIIQNIVDTEVAEGTHTGKYSCTLALLWLKRALEFILVFLRCVAEGEKDLVVCARTAYEGSLRRYHGWIVRGIFSVAVRAVPYYDPFMESLKVDSSLSNEQLIADMSNMIDALKSNIDVISDFYSTRKLEFEDTV